jgi:hypothetical protein
VAATEAKRRRRGDARDDGTRQRRRHAAATMSEAATTESGDDVKVWRGIMGRGGVATMLRLATERRTIGLVYNDVEIATMQ